MSIPGLSTAAVVSGTIQAVASRESSVVRHHDFSGIIVWLQPTVSALIEAGSPPAHASQQHARMIQKDKQFSPHVLAIHVGDTVDFPNFDPIFHNAFSNFNGQLFDIGLYPPGTSRSIHFGRAGVVRVFCNIHPAMSAVIAVLASPYFTTTGKNGLYNIAAVPAGRYEMHIIHERSTPEALEKLSRVIDVPDAGLALSTITISESGYLPAPHKNKYGRDYPATTTDSLGY